MLDVAMAVENLMQEKQEVHVSASSSGGATVFRISTSTEKK